MSSQDEHSTDAPAKPNPADALLSAAHIIQLELPDLARALIALAKAGNTTALTLAFRIADPNFSLGAQLLARLRRAADDDPLWLEIQHLLANRPVV